MRNPPTVTVEDFLPAGMKQPVIIVAEQFAGMPWVSFFLIPGKIRRTLYKGLVNEYTQREQEEQSSIADGSINLYNYTGNEFGRFSDI